MGKSLVRVTTYLRCLPRPGHLVSIGGGGGYKNDRGWPQNPPMYQPLHSWYCDIESLQIVSSCNMESTSSITFPLEVLSQGKGQSEDLSYVKRLNSSLKFFAQGPRDKQNTTQRPGNKRRKQAGATPSGIKKPNCASARPSPPLPRAHNLSCGGRPRR